VHLPAGLQLALLPEAELEHLHLLVAEPALLGVTSSVQIAAVDVAAPCRPPPPAPRPRPALPLRCACTSRVKVRLLQLSLHA
jgi:hypothetical protein